MKIAILGAGFTGLTAAYHLVKKGYKVFVLEKMSRAGGLARGFKLPGWTWCLEENYHHFFASDTEAFKLIKELGLSDMLFFKKPVTGVYYKPDRVAPCHGGSSVYPLDTPLNFLLFPHLSLFDKLRSGATLAFLKLCPFWKSLERERVYEWIKKTMGERPWKVLWEPLFVNKFGSLGVKVPASWFWARIKKRSQKLGYIKGGFQTLANEMVQKIEKLGGEVNFNCQVKEITLSKDQKFSLQLQNLSRDHVKKICFEKVVVTLPTPVFLKVSKKLPKDYTSPGGSCNLSDYNKRLSSVTYLNALTLILELKEPFLEKTYWLNICDSSFPFLLLVQHTNFIEPRHYDGRHILYIGNYLPDGHPYLSKTKEELLKIFMPYLKKINPNFNHQSSIINHQLFLAPFAQPAFPTNSSLTKPGFTTPIPGLYLATQAQIYPWDRGVNYAIELGEKVANFI